MPTMTQSTEQELADFLVTLGKSKPQDANAERVYRWARGLNPESAEAWSALGRAQLAQKKFGEAERAFAEALEIHDTCANWINLSAARVGMGYFDGAASAAKTAASRDLESILPWLQLVAIYDEMGAWDKMADAIEQGLRLDPECPHLLFARSTIRLRRGEWDAGFADYRFRPSMVELREKLDHIQEWTGGELPEGHTLLVIGEQGIGDQINFARWLPFVSKFNAVLFTRPELGRLLSQFGIPVVTSDAEVAAFDVTHWVGIGDLPGIVGAKATIEVGLGPCSRFYAGVAPRTSAFRVGVCWKGNPGYRYDKYRSLAWADVEPLTRIPGIEFYSLVWGETESGLPNLLDNSHDILDTAEQLRSLDLVVTIDTMIANLAGSLGVPTIAMIFQCSDYRWMESGSWTPWFGEHVRVVRQEYGARELVINQAYSLLETAAFSDYARSVRQNTAEILPRVATTDTRYGPMQYFTSDRWMGRALKEYGEWSEGEAELFRAVIKPGDHVVEAGANIGALTKALCEITPNVIAFEPDEETFDVLGKNCGRDSVVRWNNALGAESTKAMMARRNSGGSHISDTGDQRVEICALDGWDWRVDFLKADVEGYELEVLQGAEQTIDRCRPLLYLEADRGNAEEVLTMWLDEHGYRVYRHRPPLFNPKNWKGNKLNVFGCIVSGMLFCVPKERYDLEKVIERFRMQRIKVTRKAAA